MAWSTSDYFPEWGDTGERPSDGFQYDGGDQVNEKHLDYFLNALDEFEDDVWAALSDIDSDGDGTVDEADLALDSNQYDGTSPSDGSDGQFLTTDGSSVSWGEQTIVSNSEPPVADAGREWARLGSVGTEVLDGDNTPRVFHSLDVQDGVIYAGSDDGDTYALDASDGSLLWSQSHHSSGSNILSIDTDGIYGCSGASDGTVVMFNLSDGSQVWSHSHHTDAVNDVVQGKKMVWSASADNSVIGANSGFYVSSRGGDQEWSHTQHGESVRDLAVGDGFVYSCSGGTSPVVRADALTGSNVTSLSPQVFEQSVNTIDRIDIDENGDLYLLQQDSSSAEFLAKFSGGAEGSLTEVWSHHPFNDGNASPPCGIEYSAGRVAIHIAGKLNIYDAENGEQIFESFFPSNDAGRPIAEEDGVVYFIEQLDLAIYGRIFDKARFTSDGNEWLLDSRLR